jgi:hypothetical protein
MPLTDAQAKKIAANKAAKADPVILAMKRKVLTDHLAQAKKK